MPVGEFMYQFGGWQKDNVLEGGVLSHFPGPNKPVHRQRSPTGRDGQSTPENTTSLRLVGFFLLNILKA